MKFMKLVLVAVCAFAVAGAFAADATPDKNLGMQEKMQKMEERMHAMEERMDKMQNGMGGMMDKMMAKKSGDAPADKQGGKAVTVPPADEHKEHQH